MLSVNVTIHNKGFLLRRVLDAIKARTIGTYELVLVLDGCEDDSAAVVEDWCRANPTLKVKVLTAPNVFETKANNLAARASSGDFIAIVQDDTIIQEPGWNARLMRPFESEDVFAVSGRAAHNWRYNPEAKDTMDSPHRDDRWCDILEAIDLADRTNTTRDVFAIRDTVNRGPLLIRHDDLQALGYFDEAFAPQDCDDHDLNYRMHKKTGKVVGFYAIDWYSAPEWGGTRGPDGQPRPWLLRAHHKNVRLLVQRHADFLFSDGAKASRVIR